MAKMSTVKKGYTKEYLARKELEKEGWNIVFKSVRWRFGTIDFAKLFDIVAIKYYKWRFISVKHFGKGNYYKPHQNDIGHFKIDHAVYGTNCGMTFELWLWDKPRWTGRAPNKVWNKGGWKKIVI